MSVLEQLISAIKSATVEVIDLTARLESSTPVIQLPEPFANTRSFTLTEVSRYDERGPAWYWNDISTGEHTGTHFDAPVHWISGRDGLDVSQVPAASLIAPAVVLDFSAEAAADPDFLLERAHIKQWESDHGPLPDGGWLLYRTGWDARSASQQDFLNANETGPHTPGVSVECARWIAEEAPVMGIGVETVGTDAGAAHSFDPPFPCHSALLGAGQVRADPAAEPRGTAADRDRADRRAAAHRRRLRQPGPGAGAGGAILMRVTEAVARVLTHLGADTVFGVVGSGNFHLTNTLIEHGARYIAARHECGAATMADAWARLSWPGPALSPSIRGRASPTRSPGSPRQPRPARPLLVLAADVSSGAVTSNFRLDVAAITAGTGATPARLHSAGFAVDDAARAYRTARDERRTVVLALPLDVQAAECTWPGDPDLRIAGPNPPAVSDAADLARLLANAARPVFVAGRGARSSAARKELEQLADSCGALLATSAAAKGLFRGSPWDLDVSGGFASPLAAQLIGEADVLVAWGCSLNMWTTRHGALIGDGTTGDPGRLRPRGHRPAPAGAAGDRRRRGPHRRGGDRAPGARAPCAAAR